MNITPPDIVIMTILGFFTFNGFRHGFIEEIGKIISLISGFIFASKFHILIMPFLKPYIEDGALQIAVSYLIIFIISVLIITIFVKILQKFIELVLLGWLNRLLGLLLGLLKGFLIISIIMFAIQAIPLKLYNGETLQKKLYSESVMYQICDHVKSLIILTIPMENQIYLFQKIQKNIPSSKSIQQSQSP
tara:strand:+ start:5266 stop:5835 length:570 start_codon:yes stop_codon:yes gene_type:complete